MYHFRMHYKYWAFFLRLELTIVSLPIDEQAHSILSAPMIVIASPWIVQSAFFYLLSILNLPFSIPKPRLNFFKFISLNVFFSLFKCNQASYFRVCKTFIRIKTIMTVINSHTVWFCFVVYSRLHSYYFVTLFFFIYCIST